MDEITKEINNLMAKYKSWGMFDKLSKTEQQQVFNDLKFIAGTAIHEFNKITQNNLWYFHNEVKNLEYEEHHD